MESAHSIHRLSYPIYAASFDPHNSDFLFVGGGGGEGRSGVPNKITLLDTSQVGNVKKTPEGGKSQNGELKEVQHVDLSTDEDAVQSLAVAQSEAIAATVYVGVNSSQVDQDAGKNEHLRSLRVAYPPIKKAAEVEKSSGRIEAIPPPEALSKAALFTVGDEKKRETYQRVLRLSPARTDVTRRLGAVATGSAPAGEVVLFDASGTMPDDRDVRGRITLRKGEEAADVDIIEGKDDDYLVTYCTDADVYVCKVDLGSRTFVEPACVFEGSKRDGSFRSLRFLDQNHILLVRNLPRRLGAQLLILQVQDNLVNRKIIYGQGLKDFKAITAVDLARLPALDGAERRQYVLAAAGQPGIISIYTLDHTPQASTRITFQRRETYIDVHPLGITCLAFSNFKIPYPGTATTPLMLKLASTSFGNTVAIHTWPLKSVPNARQATHQVIITKPQSRLKADFSSFMRLAIVGIVISILIQALWELRGTAKHERLGIRNWAPLEIKYLFDIPADPADMGVPLSQRAPVIASSMPPLEPAAAARAASRQAAKAGSSVSGSVSSAASAASQEATKAASIVSDSASSAASGASSKGSSGASAVSGKAASGASGALSGVSKAQNSAASDSGSISGSASSAIVDAIESMKAAASEIPSPEEVAEKIADAMPDVAPLEEVTQRLPAPMKTASQSAQKVIKGSDTAAQHASSESFKKIRSILHAHHRRDDQPAGVEAPGAVVFRDSADGLSVSTHAHESHVEGQGDEVKRWEDLSKEEKNAWRKRLSQAGHWAEGETEKVLKGVFFGTIAGMVGAAARM